MVKVVIYQARAFKVQYFRDIYKSFTKIFTKGFIFEILKRHSLPTGSSALFPAQAIPHSVRRRVEGANDVVTQLSLPLFFWT